MNYKNNIKHEDLKQKYKNDNLLCGLCQKEKEDQPHLLRCEVLRRKFKSKQISRHNVEYNHIFSEDIHKQKEISSMYIQLLKLKTEIEAQQICQPAPSTTDMVLMMSDDLPHSIVHSSSGK